MMGTGKPLEHRGQIVCCCTWHRHQVKSMKLQNGPSMAHGIWTLRGSAFAVHLLYAAVVTSWLFCLCFHGNRHKSAENGVNKNLENNYWFKSFSFCNLTTVPVATAAGSRAVGFPLVRLASGY